MLKITELFRHLQSTESYPKLRYPFRDEYGKLTVAKYKLVGIIEGNIKDLNNYVFRLDARSVRYMRRVKIIENKKRYKKCLISASH